MNFSAPIHMLSLARRIQNMTRFISHFNCVETICFDILFLTNQYPTSSNALINFPLLVFSIVLFSYTLDWRAIDPLIETSLGKLGRCKSWMKIVVNKSGQNLLPPKLGESPLSHFFYTVSLIIGFWGDFFGLGHGLSENLKK